MDDSSETPTTVDSPTRPIRGDRPHPLTTADATTIGCTAPGPTGETRRPRPPT
ncbi:hypothetical protein [Micromonospora sp. DT47]|uniref:hypothetical protein n=1 Tax=Micromonospora sp. DT47 TaxID=3393431 RepID=UPI003CFAFB37